MNVSEVFTGVDDSSNVSTTMDLIGAPATVVTKLPEVLVMTKMNAGHRSPGAHNTLSVLTPMDPIAANVIVGGHCKTTNARMSTNVPPDNIPVFGDRNAKTQMDHTSAKASKCVHRDKNSALTDIAGPRC